MPSMRSWPLIARGRSTPASRRTTLRRAASSRSAASASSRRNETSLKRAQPRSRNSCCDSTSSLPRDRAPALERTSLPSKARLGNECLPNRCSCPSVRAVNRWNVLQVQLLGDLLQRHPLPEQRVDLLPPYVVTLVAEPMREPDVVGVWGALTRSGLRGLHHVRRVGRPSC